MLIAYPYIPHIIAETQSKAESVAQYISLLLRVDSQHAASSKEVYARVQLKGVRCSGKVE